VGWVSYRNPAYVLDLWGIASQRALRARLAGKSGEWMSRQAAGAGASLAMIYDAWFPQRPSTWVGLADLHLSRKQVSATQSTVAFYATDPSAAPHLLVLLHAFARTLPPGVTLKFRDTSPAADEVASANDAPPSS
jgi:hypothetical protein